MYILVKMNIRINSKITSGRLEFWSIFFQTIFDLLFSRFSGLRKATHTTCILVEVAQEIFKQSACLSKMKWQEENWSFGKKEEEGLDEILSGDLVGVLKSQEKMNFHVARMNVSPAFRLNSPKVLFVGALLFIGKFLGSKKVNKI